MYNDEMFSARSPEDQFDGWPIAGTGRNHRYYNGLTQAQVGGLRLQKLVMENIQPSHPRVRRRAGLNGGDRCPQLHHHARRRHQALRRQNTAEPREGDFVGFRTGHSKLWKKFNDEYNKGCPGPSNRVANWLVEKKIAVVGADTWPVEAVPGENANRPFECHVIWITMNGIFINENLNLEELARDRVYEFAWSFNPLRLKGATGSPGNSVAIA